MAEEVKSDIKRRSFLRAGAGVAIAGAIGATLEPLRDLKPGTLDGFFQQHYKRLTEDDIRDITARLEGEIGRDYGAKVSIKDPKPKNGVRFAYALNLSRCNGSRRCVTACVQENNQSRDPAIQYIKVLEMPSGTFDVEQSDHHYDDAEVPKDGKYYLPVQCQQCENPPCTKVCPVEATWKEPDGVTVIDYNWCIGCRYCMAACPYEARRFNFSKPEIPKEDINPNMGYLSNRIRPVGVVEKCHFCLHRTREGKNPACLEVCPTGARVFGDLKDPESEISYIIKNKRIYVLKEEAGTIPAFFYYFDV
jgi:Fe-S-cluster-containing dehydrogenase component